MGGVKNLLFLLDLTQYVTTLFSSNTKRKERSTRFTTQTFQDAVLVCLRQSACVQEYTHTSIDKYDSKFQKAFLVFPRFLLHPEISLGQLLFLSVA